MPLAHTIPKGKSLKLHIIIARPRTDGYLQLLIYFIHASLIKVIVLNLYYYSIYEYCVEYNVVLIIPGRPFLFGDDLTTSPLPIMAEGETLNKHYSLKNISEMSAPEDQALESVDKSLAPQFTMALEATEASAKSTEGYPNSGKFHFYHFYHF